MIPKKIAVLPLILGVALASCGNESPADEMISDSQAETSSTTEKTTEEQPTTTEDDDVYSVEDVEGFYEFDELDEDDMMLIDTGGRFILPDENGFKIRNGVVYGYDGDETAIYIPDGVRGIAPHAFWSDSKIKSVYIPPSVEEIGNGAFWSCSALEYVKAEEGLKKIHSTAFWSCPSLLEAELPSSVEFISSDVFWANENIKIYAPVGSYAEKFAENQGLECFNEKSRHEERDDSHSIRAEQYIYGEFTEFTIPDDVTAIEAAAFRYCENLEKIDIPPNVDYIGSDAFEYCYALETVNISCREVRSEAFEYCEGLKKIIVNEGCEILADRSFAYCEVIEDVYLPESLTSMGEYTFGFSPYITLHVPEGSYAEQYAIENNFPYDNNYKW